MAKGLKEFREDLRKMETMVREALPDIAIILTLSAKAISERNIKEKGFGFQYSEVKVPAWFLKGKEYSSAGEKFIEEAIDNEELIGWRDLRAAQGMQIAHVDLTFSGAMWSNMQPRTPEVNGDIVTAPLAATNKEAQSKMDWNRDRYGDFIGKSLTPDDWKNLINIVVQEFIKVITESGFNPR